MKVKEIIRFFFLPVYKPIEGLEELLKNDKRLPYSAIIFLFLGILYTISVQLAVSKGVVAPREAFIKVPQEDYYLYQRFWQAAFFFITTIVFAGSVRLLSAFVSGNGRFEDIFAIFCVTQTFPMFITMWIPETVFFVFFPSKEIGPLWLDVFRQSLGIIWPLALTVIGISICEEIKLWQSAIFTLIASIPTTLLMVMFIR